MYFIFNILDFIKRSLKTFANSISCFYLRTIVGDPWLDFATRNEMVTKWNLAVGILSNDLRTYFIRAMGISLQAGRSLF